MTRAERNSAAPPRTAKRSQPEDFNKMPLPRLYAALASTGLVTRLLDLAHAEDLATGGDVTSAVCIDRTSRGTADVVARAPGVVAGLATVPQIVKRFAPHCTLTLRAKDGQAVRKGATLATLRGPVREILAAERTLLNLVGRLSGIATRTREFVHAMHAGSARDPSIRGSLFDTRKTTPGLRVLEKYAVRCGGGSCHRMGLYDAVLIKDNHIAGVSNADLPATINRAAHKARAKWPGALRFIQVEVDTLEQFKALLTLPTGTINIVLLDNMAPPLLRKAVALRDRLQPTLELEASGGISLATVRAIAQTGVDRLSIGSLTHGATSLDVALDMRT